MSTSTGPPAFVPSAKPFTQIVDGFPVPAMFPVENYRSALSYKPRPDDIFIATYPKCGTTWAQHILLLIFRQGEPLKSRLEFYAATPYLELTGAEGGEKLRRPGAIKVHLPYRLAPGSSYCKYIYISRNPKDCCVSFFHHIHDMPPYIFNGTFDQFFEFFLSGDIDYGDYFDHLLGWYEHRNDPNVLFLTYEQMKENPEEVILKMASFIDDKLYAEPLRNDPEKMRKIIQYSSFKHMKEEVNKGMDEMLKMSKEEIMNSELPDIMKKLFIILPPPPTEAGSKEHTSQFIRKGIIGDWKNYFSSKQSQRLDEKFAERTKGTDLPDLWKKYM